MAGIGFELKRLYSKKGLFAALRATGYSTAVCVGPMILGIVLQLGIMMECIFFGKSTHDRELIICMNTYSLLFSLIVTSVFSMIVTRFLADMLFTEHTETVLPSFFGTNAITLTVGGILYAVFLTVSGTSFSRNFFVWCYFMELIVCWNSQSYLTAIKEYRGIFISYVLSIVVCLAVSALTMWLDLETVGSTIFSLCLGYGVMMIYDFVLIYRRFPDSGVSPFMFLRWMDKYKKLAMIGFCTTVGVFSHMLIIWMSPLQVVVDGLWVGAPFHDVPALLAFLTIIMTTVNFVVSVEVNFYPKYRDYYALFNNKGTIRDILRVEDEMLQVLRSELWYTALKQLFFTAAAISLGEFILNYLPLGFNDLMHGYFRTLCVAYGIYAVANTMLMILLYFTDYTGALRASVLFAVFTTLGTLLSLLFDMKYYGFGFLLGCAVFFFYTTFRLDYYTRQLRYFVLAAQPITGETTNGIFTRLGVLLEDGIQTVQSKFASLEE